MRNKFIKIVGLGKVRKNRINILIFAVVVILLAVFGGRIFGKKTQTPETQTVTRGSIKSTISASGSIEGEKQATLHFQTPGRVAWIGVKEGDKVKKWQVIAKLDAVQLNSNLQIAQSNLRAAEATLQRVYDSVKGHETDESFTQKETRTAAETAKDKAYEAVISAQNALSNSVLIAPFAGVVVSVSENITPGANASVTDTVVVADVSSFKFTAQVDEVDYGKVAMGQKAEISLDAYPDEIFTGTVSYIGKAGVKTAGGGVTIPVEVKFDSKGKNMAVGLSGDVDFILEEKDGVLILPKSFVVSKGGESKVLVLENGKEKEIFVSTGASTLTDIEITGGLSEGQIVVLPKN